ncbi:MAG TPA: TIGR01841 family phasin [Rhodoblastus sp.]|nr:TIGR01841 family phasin [Rhodoblastus sp.]
MAVRRPAKAPVTLAKTASPKAPETAVKAAPAKPAEKPAVAAPKAAAKPAAKAAEAKPVEIKAAPKQVEPAPVVKPAEPKPVEAKPVAETKPAAPKPAAAKPAAKPVDAPVKAPVAAADMAGVQDNLRKAASKTIEQGRVAFERMKEASDEATHTIEASLAASSKGAAELASKALAVAKLNANATFDHLKALASAKTLADAVSMHGQFIRTQSEAAVSQAKEFAELARKAATDAAAPIQEQIKKAQAK